MRRIDVLNIDHRDIVRVAGMMGKLSTVALVLLGCTPTAEKPAGELPPETPTGTANSTATTEQATAQPSATDTPEPAATATTKATPTETLVVEAVPTIPAVDMEGHNIPEGSVAGQLAAYLIDGKVVLGVENLELLPPTTISGITVDMSQQIGFSVWGPAEQIVGDSQAVQILNAYGDGSLVMLLPNLIADHITDPDSVVAAELNTLDLTFVTGPESIPYDKLEVASLTYGASTTNGEEGFDKYNWTMTVEAVTYTENPEDPDHDIRTVVATLQKSQAGENATPIIIDWTAVTAVETEETVINILELEQNQNPTVWLQGGDFGQYVGELPADPSSDEYKEIKEAFPTIDFSQILSPAKFVEEMRQFGFKPSFGGGVECTVYPIAGEGGVTADCMFVHIIGTISNEEYGYTSHVVQVALVTSDGKVHTLITQADINDGPVYKWDQVKNQPTQEVGTLGQSSNAVIINSQYIEANQGNKDQVEALNKSADGNAETGITDEELVALYSQTTFLTTGYFKPLGYAAKGTTPASP